MSSLLLDRSRSCDAPSLCRRRIRTPRHKDQGASPACLNEAFECDKAGKYGRKSVCRPSPLLVRPLSGYLTGVVCWGVVEMPRMLLSGGG
jgi:hypothetical protein